MGADDVIDALRRITSDPRYAPAVEWLGCPWGHAVAPSTPVQDFRLHVRAWQHHFAAHLRPGGAGPGARLLPVGDGAAQPSRRGLRVRAHAASTAATRGCWSRSTPSSTPDGGGRAPAAPAAPAGGHQLHRRDGVDHRHRQDAGQRHQAGRPDAALLRGEGPAAASTLGGAASRRSSPDRRRRERRRDDERVPAQVQGSRAASARGRARR